MAALEQISGTVSRVNEKGFQIQERPGTWFNISQYADPRPEIPAVGARVALGVDTKGFVRQITTAVDSTPSTSAPSTSAPSRETTITRLAVLKASAEFLAARPDAKSTDVLKVAACWEAWVLR